MTNDLENQVIIWFASLVSFIPLGIFSYVGEVIDVKAESDKWVFLRVFKLNDRLTIFHFSKLTYATLIMTIPSVPQTFVPLAIGFLGKTTAYEWL